MRDAFVAQGEHALARQEPQGTLERVGVRSARVGQLLNGDRAVSHVVGDAELGDDVQGTGGDEGRGQVPDVLVWLHCPSIPELPRIIRTDERGMSDRSVTRNG